MILYQAQAGEGMVGGLELSFKKTWPEGPDKVGSSGKPGLCARTRPRS